MRPVQLALSVMASLFACAPAFGSPPGGSGTGIPIAHLDRDDRQHWLDRWTFGSFGRGLGLRCRGLVGPGCRRPLVPYGYAYPYGIVLPPTGHEYVSDDWLFSLPAYDPALLYPYRGRVPYALPSLGTCPEGVQRCHDEPPGAADAPQ